MNIPLSRIVRSAEPDPADIADAGGWAHDAAGRIRRDARAVRPARGARPGRARREGGLRRRDGLRPLPALGSAAGPGRLRLECAQRARPAHPRLTRHRRDGADVPLASGDGRAGLRHPRRPLPGATLAGPRQRRGHQRPHHGSVLARGGRAHRPDVRGRRRDQEAVLGLAGRPRREARRPLLQTRIDAAVDHAGGGAAHPRRHRRPHHREARRPHRRRAHHRERHARARPPSC